MKKNVSFFLGLILFISFLTVSFADSTSDKPDTNVKYLKTEISIDPEFAIWESAKLSNKIKLYNEKDKIAAYLVNILYNEKIIGYMLLNKESNQVIEYAKGQSPYSDYLNQYLKKKSLKAQNVKLLYDGPSRYGVLSDNVIYAFTSDTDIEIEVDPLKDIKEIEKKLKEQNSSQEESVVLSTKSSYITKILSGIPGYDVKRGCGAAAGVNIVGYWDKKGYSNLISSNNDYDDVEIELHNRMLTIYVGGGNWATTPPHYEDGLQSYLRKRYSNFDVTSKYCVNSGLDFDLIQTEIYNNRPGTICYQGHPIYGYHYVTFVGYKTNGNTNYYIIKDGWHGSTNVYRNADSDDNYIWHMFTIKN